MCESNPNMPNSLPQGVEIKHISNEKGRGLFATKLFHSSDVIFEERPLVCCQLSWNASCGYKACEFCMKPLETAVENARRLSGNPSLELRVTFEGSEVDTRAFCQGCSTEYCSEECLNKAVQLYHRTLCTGTNESHPLKRLNEAWKQMHYPPETSTIMILPKILAMIYQNKEMNDKFKNFCQIAYNEQQNIVHKFLGKKYADQVSLLYDLVREAVGPEVAQPIPSFQDFQSLIALVATNGQGVGTSAFSTWVENYTEYAKSHNEEYENYIDDLYDQLENHTGLEFLNNEGVALFELQSMINHSCEPNASVCFTGKDNKLTVKAIRQINVGEEICISYLDDCELDRSRHSRQKMLSQNYLFRCRCEKCAEQAGDPDVTSEEEDMDED